MEKTLIRGVRPWLDWLAGNKLWGQTGVLCTVLEYQSSAVWLGGLGVHGVQWCPDYYLVEPAWPYPSLLRGFHKSHADAKTYGFLRDRLDLGSSRDAI